ncbi:hypothetical protein JVU11DRAFT_7899 [Chiua virens]|nr:hypothetical protein JVU11DRAFT_7899 [Chiua virens]
MPDRRVSHMLDSLVDAIDEGFSPDGIRSVPEIGLEDIAYRHGLAGLSDRVVDGFQAIKIYVGSSNLIARVFRRSQPHTPSTDTRHPRISGISTVSDVKDEFLPQGERLPRKNERRTQLEVQPPPAPSPAQERMPRKSEQDIRGLPADPALHRHYGHGGGEPVQDPLDPVLERLPRKSKQNLRDSLADPTPPGHGSEGLGRDPLGPGALGGSPRQSRWGFGSLGAALESSAPTSEDEGHAQIPRRENAPERLPRKNKHDLQGGDVGHGKRGDES